MEGLSWAPGTPETLHKYLLNVDEGTVVLEGCHEREGFMAPAWGWVGWVSL